MKKKNKYYRFSKKLKAIDERVGDFENNAIPKVTLSDDCKNEVFDLDYRCTDYGNAMDFFN